MRSYPDALSLALELGSVSLEFTEYHTAISSIIVTLFSSQISWPKILLKGDFWGEEGERRGEEEGGRGGEEGEEEGGGGGEEGEEGKGGKGEKGERRGEEGREREGRDTQREKEEITHK